MKRAKDVITVHYKKAFNKQVKKKDQVNFFYHTFSGILLAKIEAQVGFFFLLITVTLHLLISGTTSKDYGIIIKLTYGITGKVEQHNLDLSLKNSQYSQKT